MKKSISQKQKRISIDDSTETTLPSANIYQKKPKMWDKTEIMLGEAESKHALKPITYTGKMSFARNHRIKLTDQVVLTLMHGHEEQQISFMNNFYS